METLTDIKVELSDPRAGASSMGGAAREIGAPQLDQAAIDAREARAWAQLPKQIGAILCMALPELAQHYSDENCLRWGEAVHEVAKAHGIDSSVVGPYLGLILASVPLVVPTVQAIRARRAGAPPAGAPAAPAAKQSGGAVMCSICGSTDPGKPARCSEVECPSRAPKPAPTVRGEKLEASVAA